MTKNNCSIFICKGNLEDLVNFMPLNAVWHGTDLENALEDRFKYLLNKLKETG